VVPSEGEPELELLSKNDKLPGGLRSAAYDAEDRRWRAVRWACEPGDEDRSAPDSGTSCRLGSYPAHAHPSPMDSEIGRYLASLSHELLTPPNAIIGFTGHPAIGLPAH